MFLASLLLSTLVTLPLQTTTPAGTEQVVETEGGPEGPVTERAIRTTVHQSDVRGPWRSAGVRGRRPVSTDYDRDGMADTARLVQTGTHAGVMLRSGRTGTERLIWLIPSDGLASDVFLEKGDNGTIVIVFPESTTITLYDDKGTAMATYQNG